MPLISYAPAGLAASYTLASRTVGQVTSVVKASQTPAATAGTLPAVQASAYPVYGLVGKVADAGEVADCLNQLVSRIESLEAIIQANPAYGITET